MDDWDEEDVAVKAVPSTWDDDANDVPDTWDVVATEPKKEAEPQKTDTTHKVSKKNTKKEKKAPAKLEISPQEAKDEEETAPRELTEKERERLAEEAELDLIVDSFGGGLQVATSQQDDVRLGNPKTENEFVTLASKLSERIRSFETSPHYSKFFEGIIRQISLEVDLDTLKDVSTFIDALIVEKQKLAKGKTKKKAGKTAKLIVERKNDYDYDMGGDDDFGDFI
nr:unnamed protein product [Spirometra erinaceieuropaei]